ncbi:MAG: adenylosuccinate synthase [Bacillota bacterium]
MPAVVVVGAQWGDEGKGKVIDYLAGSAEVIVRYQGGNNAGHTMVVRGVEYKLHLIPSGILYPGKACFIGSGVVVDPWVLVRELDYLEARGVDTGSFRVSGNAHLILPYHLRLDELEEERKGTAAIGTTRRGIGPAYMDKYTRDGLRMADMLDEAVMLEVLARNVSHKNNVLERMYHSPGVSFAEIADGLRQCAERIRPYITDTSLAINRALDQGKRVLFEGAQGTMLDIDYGTYPYVTSSHPVAGGACIGAGVGPTRIDQVIGVVKAYTSRVGEGPFPTELSDATGEWIRVHGLEYGTTTGRPRRCGWLDTVVLRYSARLSGLTGLALTHLDTLTGLDPVRICVGYEMNGRREDEVPLHTGMLGHCRPVYVELPGWQENLGAAESFDALPAAARAYVAQVERLTGVPVVILSIGRDRRQTIGRAPIFA